MNPTLFRAVAKRPTLIAALAPPAIATHAHSAPDPALDDVRLFFNDTATAEIYTLSLHDALPI